MNWPIKVLSDSPSRYRSIQQINQDIDDELQFHLDCRIEDLCAEGMSQFEAETAARAAFGSQASIRQQCRNVNYGTYTWFLRLAMMAFALCAVSMAWLVYELVTVNDKNNQLLTALERATSPYSDVAGTVFDEAGQGIEGADVLITIKSWPDGRYQQCSFTTRTSRDGSFRYPDLIPNQEVYAVVATIMVRGFACETVYTRKRHKSYRPFRPLNFKLQAADPVRIQITDDQGTPVQNAVVCPAARQSDDGEHCVYADAAAVAQLDSAVNSSGWVELPYFRIGDHAEIRFKTPEMEDWARTIVYVEKKDQQFQIETSDLRNSY